ncbi:MAG: hypothetical protein JOZ22_13880, partial [Acidobacteriia bacterium]|nr:hypothetical protein [Terriglobia bacterium]
VTVSGGGETNTGNDNASDATPILGSSSISVSIQTNTSGLSFSVDGVTYTTSQVFSWAAGSAHTIATTTLQAGGAGTQYAWSGWSDGGLVSHTVSPTAPVTITANFITQYLLSPNVLPAGSGSVTENPSSATGYYTAGTPVQLTAIPATGFGFVNWSGDASVSGTVTMSAPRSVTANFQATVSVTIQTNPAAAFTVDGNAYSGSHTFSWTPGTSHVVATSATQTPSLGTQYSWVSWSDGGALSHSIAPGGNTTLTAQFSTQYLLTATATPSAAGSVAASPSSSTGYYASGTSVQVSAVANTGYAFTSWTGDLTGTATTQTLTMSAPHTVGAVFQPVLTAVTKYALNSPPLRNNFSGFVGTSFGVGFSSLTVRSLGRLCIGGNSSIHTVKLVAATGVDLPGGSVSVNMSGCTAGQFVYVPLANPITLPASTGYYLVSQEVAGSDQWYDYGTVQSTSDLTIAGSVYSNGSSWVSVTPANTSYVPPNFQYSVASDLITGYNLNNRPLRNNFSGWVGTQFTVGPAGLTVNALGRIFVPGNSGTHTIKIVQGSGADVPGASVTLSMAGGTAGQFIYTALPSPISLAPNASYYLVSQEVLGGDQWYDFNSVSTTSAVTITNAVYSPDGVTWIAAGGPNMSYVPANLK